MTAPCPATQHPEHAIVTSQINRAIASVDPRVSSDCSRRFLSAREFPPGHGLTGGLILRVWFASKPSLRDDCADVVQRNAFDFGPRQSLPAVERIHSPAAGRASDSSGSHAAGGPPGAPRGPGLSGSAFRLLGHTRLDAAGAGNRLARKRISEPARWCSLDCSFWEFLCCLCGMRICCWELRAECWC